MTGQKTIYTPPGVFLYIYTKMKKEIVGIIGQYGCLVTMFIGLGYEIAAGAHIGWTIFTAGAISAMIFTKIRGK